MVYGLGFDSGVEYFDELLDKAGLELELDEDVCYDLRGTGFELAWDLHNRDFKRFFDDLAAESKEVRLRERMYAEGGEGVEPWRKVEQVSDRIEKRVYNDLRVVGVCNGYIDSEDLETALADAVDIYHPGTGHADFRKGLEEEIDNLKDEYGD